jgi:NAD(P)-dependent dehydrogenase (short-subunit alcohol dehydrogenase family)
MKILVLGGSGATGRRLVLELIYRGHEVIAVVRSKETLANALVEIDPEISDSLKNLSVVEAPILELGTIEIENLVEQSDGIASCLGHNLTFKGIFGKPRHLVTDAVKLTCDAVISTKSDKKTKFVLMNTTANQDRSAEERRKFAEKALLRILRLVLPPHKDNEDAAEYLRCRIGTAHKSIDWVAVRPDSLTNNSQVSAYSIHTLPTRSPLFDPGETSRVNVAHFMAELLVNDECFVSWKGKMPVIYNA